MRKLTLALLLVLLCSACGILPETDDRRIVHPGDLAFIRHGSSADIPIALSKNDAHALARAFESGDDSAVLRIVQAGRAIMIPAQVRVRVTGESYNERCVQVLEGAHSGKVGWVPFEWLKFTRGQTG